MRSANLIQLAVADVCKTIRVARKSQKLTQTELGLRAGLSRMPIYRIEAGQDISLRTLLTLLSALRLDLQMPPLPTCTPRTQSDLARET